MINLPCIFLANVGVNASHSGLGLKSPRFPDGSFEFVTIPERPALQKRVATLEQPDGLVRYRDLTCFNWPGQPLTDFLPSRTHHLPTHYDPEFAHFTYGDEGSRAGRAAALKTLCPGDWLFFLARLTDYDLTAHKFLDTAGFYLVGFLEIETIMADVRVPLDATTAQIFGHNAHLRRAQAWPELFYDGFYVFKGSVRSRRFQYAYPFGRAQAELLLRDRHDQEWQWKAERSDLQTIGSYTRTCRCVLDPQTNQAHATRALAWLELSRNLLEEDFGLRELSRPTGLYNAKVS